MALDLSGTWLATVGDESNRRTFAEPRVDDSTWEPIAVPSHWRSTPAFADSDGPLLYRTHFDAAGPESGSRSWLVLDGLFYQGDVWLDGAYVGDTEGYFNRHTFEVSDLLHIGTEHVLAIEVSCAKPDDKAAKRTITGVFDDLEPNWNPGGIWRPVRIETTGPVRARSLRVLCADANAERAIVACRAELDSDAARTVTLRTTVAGIEQDDERPIAEGSNFVEWQVTVPNPELWWPHALGEQPLFEVGVEVRVDDDVSHRVGRRIGFRSVSFAKLVMSVNGERLFLKGANLAPPRAALSDASEAELRHDVEVAKRAGLDLLRVRAHVSRPELYRAADEAGMLLWQDLPLRRGYARGVRKQAARQASAMVDMLGHRPSIVIWCGHDEPFVEGSGLRELVGQELPTFNRSILDRAVKRAIEKADGSRPVIAHSGVWPHVGGDGTDTHLSLDDERDLAGFARAFPRMVRFVGDFGAAAAPAAVRHQIETLRRLKYRPTGGFCAPEGSYDAVAEACRPVVVVCDRPPATVAPGEALALDVHVVSDLRTPIEDAVVEAHVRWAGGQQSWRWGGDVPADDCVRVGTITLVVPDVSGPLVIALTCDEVETRYESVIGVSLT